jgi:hypothetical protein
LGNWKAAARNLVANAGGKEKSKTIVVVYFLLI